jgi:hypothetical protein
MAASVPAADSGAALVGDNASVPLLAPETADNKSETTAATVSTDDRHDANPVEFDDDDKFAVATVLIVSDIWFSVASVTPPAAKAVVQPAPTPPQAAAPDVEIRSPTSASTFLFRFTRTHFLAYFHPTMLSISLFECTHKQNADTSSAKR